MHELPFVDRHETRVAAPPEAVFPALLARMRAMARTPGARTLARALGTDAGPESILGFRVVVNEPPRRLYLEGRHRFSVYRLAFDLHSHEGGTRLVAETRAAFPGAAGAVYRALVIGTHGHVLAVRRILRDARRAAER